MIAELDERGVPVVFVTGPPLRWAEEVFQYVGAHGLAVVSNGALRRGRGRNEVDLVREIPVDVGLEVCRLIREAVPGATFAVETLAGIALESVFLERHPVPEGSRRGDLADVFDAPALKILARHEELPAQEFWDLALAAVADRAVITWSSASALLEISAAGVTKASTLALLLRPAGGGPADVIVFATCRTTCRCSSGRAGPGPWPTATRRCSPRPTTLVPGHDDDGVETILAGLYDL